MKHTPGPWTRKEIFSHQIYAGQKHIATAHYAGNPCVDAQEATQNARLISTAPDMEEALKLALRYMESPEVQSIPFALPAANVARQIRNILNEIEKE